MWLSLENIFRNYVENSVFVRVVLGSSLYGAFRWIVSVSWVMRLFVYFTLFFFIINLSFSSDKVNALYFIFWNKLKIFCLEQFDNVKKCSPFTSKMIKVVFFLIYSVSVVVFFCVWLPWRWYFFQNVEYSINGFGYLPNRVNLLTSCFSVMIIVHSFICSNRVVCKLTELACVGRSKVHATFHHFIFICSNIFWLRLSRIYILSIVAVCELFWFSYFKSTYLWFEHHISRRTSLDSAINTQRRYNYNVHMIQ